MLLTVEMFHQNKIFLSYCHTWREKDDGDKTLTNFYAHFDKAHKTHKITVTAAQAGYNGAHSVTENANAAIARNAPGTTTAVQVDTVKMYYCWTHGLTRNKEHTSATCTHKKDGHQDDATIHDIKGGSTRFMVPRSQRPKRVKPTTEEA